MTHQEFCEFIKEKSPTEIIPNEFNGFRIAFDNGEIISISSDYDGVAYSYYSDTATLNSELFKQLIELSPSYGEYIIKKYGDQKR